MRLFALCCFISLAAPVLADAAVDHDIPAHEGLLAGHPEIVTFQAAPDFTHYYALASMVMGIAGLIVGAAHSLGISRILSNHLRELAAQPGNKLSPLELAIAAHVDAGDDEALLATAKGALAGKSVGPIPKA